MMLLNSYPDRQSEQLCGIGAEARRPVEYSEPSEVVGEVFRGNTLESDHPRAQARSEGIDVLHVPSALYADASREIDRMMLDFEVPRGGGKRGAPISTQHRVGRQDSLVLISPLLVQRLCATRPVSAPTGSPNEPPTLFDI